MPSPEIVEQIQLRALTAQPEELYGSIAKVLPPGVSDQIGGGAALRLRVFGRVRQGVLSQSFAASSDKSHLRQGQVP